MKLRLEPFRLFAFSLCTLVAVAHSACVLRDQPRAEVKIRPLDNRTAVTAGHQKGLVVEIDPDARAGVKFQWSANRGKILGEGRAVTYAAPPDAGKDTVTAEASINGRMLGSSSMEIEILPACPPFQIQSLGIRGNPSGVRAGTQATLELTTEPADAAGLKIAWKAERGKVPPLASEGRTAAYRAPDVAGMDRVTAEARDSCGLVATRSLEISIEPTLPPPPAPDKGTKPPIAWIYDFEKPEGGVMGWRDDLNEADGAVQDLKRSRERSHRGNASLELSLKLYATDPQLRSGEAAVRVDLNPPLDGTATEPVDMKNKKLFVSLWLPKDFPIDPDNPHGIQLFLKDTGHRALYGCWTAIDDRGFLGRWRDLKLDPGDKAGSDCGGHKDTGFDAAAVRIIGLKVGLNPNSSARGYTGSCFIDTVEVR